MTIALWIFSIACLLVSIPYCRKLGIETHAVAKQRQLAFVMVPAFIAVSIFAFAGIPAMVLAGEIAYVCFAGFLVVLDNLKLGPM